MSKIFKKSFVSLVKSIYGPEFVPLHRPIFAGSEKQYLIDCIDSNFVSSVGEKVTEFEREIADFTGSKYSDIAIVVSKELSADELIGSIKSLKQADLVDVNLFDVYEGEHIEQGSKSVALNLTYQSTEVTLTDEQLAEKVSKIVAHLETNFSAKLR